MPSQTSRIFYLIVLSQFCGTSLWFAGNAVLPEFQTLYQWPDSAVGHLTSVVQIGFITGTLLVAITGITDKYSPSLIFFISCCVGSLVNIATVIIPESYYVMLLSRLGCGICLAGIYPVGMKIASDWQLHGLGNWLGALVGALALGTSFPHLLVILPRIDATLLPWIISGLVFIGGLAVYLFIPDGPYRKAATQFTVAGIREAFKITEFRKPAYGYFGHMWELYTFWAFIPALLAALAVHHNATLHISFWSFTIMACGALGCLIGGKFSKRAGSSTVATVSLFISGLCCLLSPIFFLIPVELFFAAACVWGFFVVSDSPQFSALVAQHAPPLLRGSAITMTTCIGFAITIFSIQLATWLVEIISIQFLFWMLLPGPILGLLAMKK